MRWKENGSNTTSEAERSRSVHRMMTGSLHRLVPVTHWRWKISIRPSPTFVTPELNLLRDQRKQRCAIPQSFRIRMVTASQFTNSKRTNDHESNEHCVHRHSGDRHEAGARFLRRRARAETVRRV